MRKAQQANEKLVQPSATAAGPRWHTTAPNARFFTRNEEVVPTRFCQRAAVNAAEVAKNIDMAKHVKDSERFRKMEKMVDEADPSDLEDAEATSAPMDVANRMAALRNTKVDETASDRS